MPACRAGRRPQLLVPRGAHPADPVRREEETRCACGKSAREVPRVTLLLPAGGHHPAWVSAPRRTPAAAFRSKPLYSCTLFSFTVYYCSLEAELSDLGCHSLASPRHRPVAVRPNADPTRDSTAAMLSAEFRSRSRLRLFPHHNSYLCVPSSYRAACVRCLSYECGLRALFPSRCRVPHVAAACLSTSATARRPARVHTQGRVRQTPPPPRRIPGRAVALVSSSS